ncbi:MAG: FadR/GntR family transcriptional regulator [Limnohabitans sp.]
MSPRPTPPLASPPRQRRGGLVQEVVEHLPQQIQSGQIQAGEKLPTESAVMRELGVSRTVVREAISRLQASGLVETRHGIGTFALDAPSTHNFRIAEQDMATVDDVIAVLELRISLETEAAGLAAQRASPEQLTAMAAALHSFSIAMHNQSDAVPSDFQFHMEVAKATGNRHFADLMTYLGTHIIPRTRINTADQAPEGRQAYLARVHGEHEKIFQAIRKHDSETARAAMRSHLSNSRDRLLKARDQAL